MELRLGTRSSPLALCQANWVKDRVEERNPSVAVTLVHIKTTGDKIDTPLFKVGGKGLFVKEIEEALLTGEADLAVHSMKDVPTEFPAGLHLTAICRREDPRDAFISGGRIPSFKALPDSARVGTSSLRRACQLLHIRPDIKIMQLRGNLETRFRKLDEGQFDAMILASAGVKRLGWGKRITEIIEPSTSLPAIGQGAIGIECRIDDEFIRSLVAPLNHDETSICVRAERSLLKRLQGGCQVPIAAYAVVRDGTLIMDGLVGSVDGIRIIREHLEGDPAEAEMIGRRLAEMLLEKGADKILTEVYGSSIDLSDAAV